MIEISSGTILIKGGKIYAHTTPLGLGVDIDFDYEECCKHAEEIRDAVNCYEELVKIIASRDAVNCYEELVKVIASRDCPPTSDGDPNNAFKCKYSHNHIGKQWVSCVCPFHRILENLTKPA